MVYPSFKLYWCIGHLPRELSTYSSLGFIQRVFASLFYCYCPEAKISKQISILMSWHRDKVNSSLFNFILLHYILSFLYLDGSVLVWRFLIGLPDWKFRASMPLEGVWKFPEVPASFCIPQRLINSPLIYFYQSRVFRTMSSNQERVILYSLFREQRIS